MAGETAEAIGSRLGVSSSTVYKMARKYALPKRPREPRVLLPDPSPEEIERLKAELKAQHIRERMNEDPTNTTSKVSKWRRQESAARPQRRVVLNDGGNHGWC